LSIQGPPSQWRARQLEAYLAPINNTPGTPNFGNNTLISVTLNDGRQVVTAYTPSPAGDPFAMTMLSGPTNYQADISCTRLSTSTSAGS
jgi:hypothetical protein